MHTPAGHHSPDATGVAFVLMSWACQRFYLFFILFFFF